MSYCYVQLAVTIEEEAENEDLMEEMEGALLEYWVRRVGLTRMKYLEI